MIDWDTVVVGAGPGGASAAYHLARAGLRVALLERRAFPRDKSCGDGLTRSGTRILREMGVLQRLPYAHLIRGALVHLRGEGTRDFPFPLERYPGTEAITVPRMILDEATCERAVAAGAILHEHMDVRAALLEDEQVVGVVAVDRDGTEREFRSRAVVAADGAMSRLARQLGLRGAGGPELGTAVRAYYETDSELGDRMEFHLLLADASGRVLLPSYGWVFPTGRASANIGVGIFERVAGQNVRHLMERFLAQLAQDPRFARLEQRGPLLGAPLRFDFDPERAARGGLFLVGDAAGMVSPFTGEGISYALESGKIVADTIARTLAYHPTAVSGCDDYALRMSKQFAGYFESGRYSGARYRAVWRALRGTFQSERPVHAIARRLILVPDVVTDGGQGEVLEEVGPLLPRSLDLRDGLIEVTRLLHSTVRRDWPFLARLFNGHVDPASTPLRPSVLALLSAYFGNPEAAGLCEAAAAIELGALSVLAHAGAADDVSADGNAFTVLLAEFLLAESYELASRAGPAATAELSGAISDAVRGRIRRHRVAHRTDRTESDVLFDLDMTVGTLGALPCRLGAQISGAPPEHQAALDTFGRRLAMAHALVDECRAAEGADDVATSLLLADVRDGLYGLAILRALRSGTSAAGRLSSRLGERASDSRRVLDEVASSGVLPDVRAEAARQAELAREALLGLPQCPARVALERLAVYAVDRQCPRRRDLRRMMSMEEA